MKISMTRPGTTEKTDKNASHFAEVKKLIRLKQQTGVRLGIVFIATALLGLAYYISNQWLLGLEDEKRRINSQTSLLNNDIQQKEAEFAKAKQSIELYHTIRRQANKGEKALDRQQIVSLLGDLKRRHYIVSLEMEMTPLQTLQGDSFTSKSKEVQHSIMTLNFGAITDELALRFLQEIVETLPGYVRTETIDLSRTGVVNEGFLRELASGNFSSLVEGRFVLHLFSLQTIREGGVTNVPSQP